MKRLALRTGVRWKISIAIAAVGALIAVALSLVVHNAARVSMIENAREVQLERLLGAQRFYEAASTQKNLPKFGAKLNDPAIPPSLRDEVRKNRRATHVAETPDGVPDVWAAVPLANGDVLSLHTRFADRSATIMDDLDRAL
ncbi:two-component sensor histidine kinase, partial [Streptomyces cavourensis]|nr:two-component sensor histidine kinase [Streptomyces cavourensis]